MDVFDGCDIEERELSVLQVDNQCVILAGFRLKLTGGAAPLGAAERGGAAMA